MWHKIAADSDLLAEIDNQVINVIFPLFTLVTSIPVNIISECVWLVFIPCPCKVTASKHSQLFEQTSFKPKSAVVDGPCFGQHYFLSLFAFLFR